MNLITGGSSFIGINTARKLIARGQRVRILDISPPDLNIDNDRVQYLNVDIRNKQEAIKSCKGVKTVFHIVSLVPISKAGKNFWEVNVEGTRNILEGQ
jgi:nucleoside-diphosphate-sugar epimerase